MMFGGLGGFQSPASAIRNSQRRKTYCADPFCIFYEVDIRDRVKPDEMALVISTINTDAC